MSFLPEARSVRIGVLGAGAIGGFIAAALSRAGNEVCVVARGDHLRAIQQRGSISVIGSDLGTFDARVEASDDLRTFTNLDYVLLTFKSHQWQGMLPQLEPAVKNGASIVSLQNGLPFWYTPDKPLESVDPGGAIARALPRDQIVGAVVHASGHIVSAGAVHQSGGMLYPMGALDAASSTQVERLSAAFAAAGMSAPVEADIKIRIWRKLVNNTAFNPVSALTRSTMSAMLHDAPLRALVHAIISEGLAVARATGVDPGVDANERLKWAEHIADVKTSMLQDLEARKPLELEPIAGAVIELAHRCDTPVPHIETVYALTKQLERTIET